MFKTLLSSAALGAALALTACGGGGSGGTTTPPPTGGGNDPPPEQRSSVPGPLDALQDPLSDTIFGGLVDATAGTPLEAILICADYVVAQDTLDVVDTLAVALQAAAGNPSQGTALFDAASGDMTESVEQLAADLQGLLNALAGTGACGATSGKPSGGALGTNPLAGTPLEPLGAALSPVLGAIGAGGSGDVDLTTLAELVSDLNDAFQSGLAAVPPEARSAPVLGAVLDTLSTALDDLEVTTAVMGSYNGAQTADRLATLVDHLLVNVLTQVVPLTTIEDESGQGPIVSGQIITGVHTLTAALESGLASPLTSLFSVLSGQMSSLSNPIDSDVLAPILAAISGALDGGAIDGNLFAGTPLAVLGDLLTTVSGGVLGGLPGGATGTPLDLILQPILDAVNGGGIGACPLGGTPLAGLCTVVDSLLDALTASPGADPQDVLTDVIDSVLDLLGLGGLLG